MRHFRNVSLLILSGLVLFSFIYIYGCNSMESTTGKLAYQQKDYEKAVKELTIALQNDKTDDEGWYMLGFSQIETGRFEEAKKSFKTCLSISNRFAKNINVFWVDNFNFGIGSFNDGIRFLRKPDSVNANIKFNQGIYFFRACTCIIPDSILAYELLGDTYQYIGKKDSAELNYDIIYDKLKIKPDIEATLRFYYRQGLDYRFDENWGKAIDIFGKSAYLKNLKSDPSLLKDTNITKYYEGSLFNLGLAYYQVGAKIFADPNYIGPDASIPKADYKSYLKKSVDILEPLVAQTKINVLLIDSYGILINAYDGLGMEAKRDDAQKKKTELEKK